MKPAEKVAVLTAMQAGLKAELDAAKAEVLAEGDRVDSDKFRTSGFGPVTIVHPERKPFVLNEPLLLAWVEEHHPEQVKRSVQPAFMQALLARLEVRDGVAVDPETGESPAWAGVTHPEPYVTWAASKEQKALKDEAKRWFSGRADKILGAIRAITSDAA